MGVESVFEMYTFLWGWHQYNAIWNILLDTGLAFVPFIGMLFNTFTQTFTSQDPGEASFASLKTLEVNIVSALLVIIIAAQPIVSVDLEEMEFVSICVGVKQLEQKHNIPSERPPNAVGFERLDMADFNSVKLPAWWFAVLSVSHGIVHAAKKGLPCVHDIRQLRVSTRVHDLRDTDLLQDLIQFGQDCYLPAMSLFAEHERGFASRLVGRRTLVDNIEKVFGEQDTAWMGSQVFTLVNGYYNHLSLMRPFGDDGDVSPVSCRSFWTGMLAKVRDEFSGVTLPDDPNNNNSKKPILDFMLDEFKQKVPMDDFILVMGPFGPTPVPVDFLPSNVQAAIAEVFPGKDPKQYVREQAILRALLDSNVAFDPITFANDPTWSFYHRYNQAASTIGQKITQVSHYGTVDAFAKSVPFVGALILMCIYIFLPLAIVAASYSLKFLIIGAIGVFGAKFFFYLFHLAWWIDQNYLLMVARSNGKLEPFFQSSYTSLEVTIGLVTTSMYFVLPLLWTMVVSWTAFGVADSFSGSLESTSPAQAIGQRINSMMDRFVYRGVQTATHYGISMFKKGKSYLILHKDSIQKANTDFETLAKYLGTAFKSLDEQEDKLKKVEEQNQTLNQRLNDAKQKYGPLDKKP